MYYTNGPYDNNGSNGFNPNYTSFRSSSSGSGELPASCLDHSTSFPVCTALNYNQSQRVGLKSELGKLIEPSLNNNSHEAAGRGQQNGGYASRFDQPDMTHCHVTSGDNMADLNMPSTHTSTDWSYYAAEDYFPSLCKSHNNDCDINFISYIYN